jgi:hypothetical protein
MGVHTHESTPSLRQEVPEAQHCGGCVQPGASAARERLPRRVPLEASTGRPASPCRATAGRSTSGRSRRGRPRTARPGVASWSSLRRGAGTGAWASAPAARSLRTGAARAPGAAAWGRKCRRHTGATAAVGARPPPGRGRAARLAARLQEPPTRGGQGQRGWGREALPVPDRDVLAHGAPGAAEAGAGAVAAAGGAVAAALLVRGDGLGADGCRAGCGRGRGGVCFGWQQRGGGVLPAATGPQHGPCWQLTGRGRAPGGRGRGPGRAGWGRLAGGMRVLRQDRQRQRHQRRGRRGAPHRRAAPRSASLAHVEWTGRKWSEERSDTARD